MAPAVVEPLSPLFASSHIQTHRRDEDGALDNVLHEIADVEQRHSVVETRHDQRTEAGTEDGAASTDE